jgi:hypothetical protein
MGAAISGEVFSVAFEVSHHRANKRPSSEASSARCASTPVVASVSEAAGFVEVGLVVRRVLSWLEWQ